MPSQAILKGMPRDAQPHTRSNDGPTIDFWSPLILVRVTDSAWAGSASHSLGHPDDWERAMGPGEFTRGEKEMVAAVVSGVNTCEY